jgi:hypothetical protein
LARIERYALEAPQVVFVRRDAADLVFQVKLDDFVALAGSGVGDVYGYLDGAPGVLGFGRDLQVAVFECRIT